MPNPVGHVPAYRDELGAVINRNTGANSPASTTVGNLRIYTFTPGDWVPMDYQINHDVNIPPAGNVILHPHVHFTFAAAPANGATVIWEYIYVYAKPLLVTTGKGTGAATYTAEATLTSPTFTCDGTEGLQHFITDLGDISIPLADFGVSLDIWGIIRLKATSTVAAGKVGLRWNDIHKSIDRFGTSAEYA